MTNLSIISEEIVSYLNFYIDGVLNANDPVQIGTYSVAVSNYYEAVAICELLLDAEVDEFFHLLIRSAQTRIWLLERSQREGGYSPKALKISNSTGLFDALAANQFKLAERIASLSPIEWYTDVEYEDDYLYTHFLHRYLLSDPISSLTSILDQMEVELDGDDFARLDLCHCLLEQRQVDCDSAFSALLEERRSEIEKIREHSVYATEAMFYVKSMVFVEGLAWLRLLERAGICMDVDDEYPYCPSLARNADFAAFRVTTFPGIPLEL
jgi:hypothetical protein